MGFNEGMELKGVDDDCVFLDKAIYGLVQDVHQFFKKNGGACGQTWFQQVYVKLLFVDQDDGIWYFDPLCLH